MDFFVENWLTILLALLGLLVGIYFGVKSIKKRKLEYYLKTTNMISTNPLFENLKLTYLSKEIQNFSYTNIYFVSRGRETIRGADIPSNDKIVIRLKEDVDIFHVIIRKFSNEACKVSYEFLNNECNIDFEYLDHKDFFVVQIFHTGKHDSDVSIAGSVMGYGKISRNVGYKNNLICSNVKKLDPLRDFSRNYTLSVLFFILLTDSILTMVGVPKGTANNISLILIVVYIFFNGLGFRSNFTARLNQDLSSIF